MFETYQLFNSNGSTASVIENRHNGQDVSSWRWERTSLDVALNAAVQGDAYSADIEAVPIEDQDKVKGSYSPLGNFLYGLENLRKRGTAFNPGEQDDDLEEVEGST